MENAYRRHAAYSIHLHWTYPYGAAKKVSTEVFWQYLHKKTTKYPSQQVITAWLNDCNVTKKQQVTDWMSVTKQKRQLTNWYFLPWHTVSCRPWKARRIWQSGRVNSVCGNDRSLVVRSASILAQRSLQPQPCQSPQPWLFPRCCSPRKSSGTARRASDRSSSRRRTRRGGRRRCCLRRVAIAAHTAAGLTRHKSHSGLPEQPSFFTGQFGVV